MSNSKSFAQKGLAYVGAACAALILSLVCVSAYCVPSYALEETYNQSDGYEPYMGWQDTKWHQGKDSDYDGGIGGAPTGRKGHPSYSLITPLSKGVTAFQNGLVTGDAITIVTDTNKTNYDTACAFTDPYYYKNIVLTPMDATQDIEFTMSAVAPGGRVGGLIPDAHGGGIIIATTDDPASWNETGDPNNFVDSDKVVYRVKTGNTTSTSSNWWGNFHFTIPAGTLEANKTYYLALTNNTRWGHTHLHANIVFEFTTDMNAKSMWVGDETKAGYGKEQGTGDLKLGIEIPHPSKMTVDLSMLDQGVYMNTVTEPMVFDENGLINFRLHADGSGSNHQEITGWINNPGLNVYDVNPVTNTDAQPVVTGTNGITATTEGTPTYDGTDIHVAGLQPGHQYFFKIDKTFNPGNSYGGFGKDVVIAFNTPADMSALGDMIDAAQDALAEMVVSEDGKDLPNHARYILPATKDAVEAAIADAQTVLENPLALQADVDAAQAALKAAMASLETDALEAATDFGPLQELINKVKADKDAAIKQVVSGEVTVSPDALKVLETVIDQAQGLIDADEASQLDVAAMMEELQAVADAFTDTIAPVVPEAGTDDSADGDAVQSADVNKLPATNDFGALIGGAMALIALIGAALGFTAYRRLHN